MEMGGVWTLRNLLGCSRPEITVAWPGEASQQWICETRLSKEVRPSAKWACWHERFVGGLRF